MKYLFSTLLFILFSLNALIANNIHVSDPVVSPDDYFANEVKIGINITWENSWRCEPGKSPHNWDAAWIFIKYKRSDFAGEWRHATIKGTKRGPNSQDTIPTDKKGVMLFRKNPGFGTFSDTLTIIWDRAKDIEASARPTAASEICVFAIEMVNVPQGSFYLGDGTLSDGTLGNEYGTYRKGGTAGATIEPHYVTGEASINMYANHGNTTGNICYISPTTPYGNAGGPLHANYPKGYNMFYCMKTEISQGQYCAFLNKLGDTQIKPHPANTIYTYNCLDFANDEALLRKYGNTITKNASGVYEVGDPYRACNFLTSQKVLAYLAWSGLRPMSCMEYEKACRGPVSPRRGEFAWGRVSPTDKAAEEFEGDPESEIYTRSDEVVPNFNITQITRGNEQAEASPGRVGAFATASSDRKDAGASYYGILDLSGNVAELVVNWLWNGSPNYDRNQHGTGLPLVDYGGFVANIVSWPIISSTVYTSGYGHKGGSFMCKPTEVGAGGTNNYIWDNASGRVCDGDRIGSNGANNTLNTYPRTSVYDCSYNTWSGVAGALYLHGFGGRGVRSF